MAEYFDRYDRFRTNTGTKIIPGLKISVEPTDKRVVYKVGKTRFDKLSDKHYGNPYHGWLILLANPKAGGLEFDIEDGEILRIPFPFKSALERYNYEVDKHIRLYGE